MPPKGGCPCDMGQLFATGSTFCNFAALFNAPLGVLYYFLRVSPGGSLCELDLFHSRSNKKYFFEIVETLQFSFFCDICWSNNLLTFFFSNSHYINQPKKIEGRRSHFDCLCIFGYIIKYYCFDTPRGVPSVRLKHVFSQYGANSNQPFWSWRIPAIFRCFLR